MPFPIFSLPSEIIIAILLDVDVPDLLRCRQVCRSLNTTIASTLSLQYVVALYTAGLSECSTNTIPTLERLKRLTQHVRRWKYIQPASRASIALSLHASSLYELYGGVFARGTALPSSLAREDALRSRRMPTSGLHVVDLPSALSGRPIHSWEREDVGFTVADFTFDAALDLWVGVERRFGPGQTPFTIHLRSFISNRPHPLATQPALTHTLDAYPFPPGTYEEEEVLTHYTMQICGHMLGILFQHHAAEDVLGGVKKEELIIWDWQAGRRCAEITPEDVQEEEAHSFSFLSTDVVLLAKTRYDEGLLDIIQLSSSAPSQPTPASPSSSPTSSPMWSPTSSRARKYPGDGEGGDSGAIRIATFKLPKLRRDWMYTTIISRSDPAPVPRPFSAVATPSTTPDSPSQGSGSALPEQSPREPLFQPRPEARVFVFTLYLLSITGNQTRRLLLFVPLTTLLQPVREHQRQLQSRLNTFVSPTPEEAGSPPRRWFFRPRPTYRAIPSHPYNTIPWPAWGPKARLIPERHPASHACYVAGWRYVTYDPLPAALHLPMHASVGVCRVRVWDFNPVALRKELQQGPGQAQEDTTEDLPADIIRRIVTGPSAPAINEVFAEKDRSVQTALPYSECIAQVVFPDAVGVLLDMERIIVMRRVDGRQVLDVAAF